MIDYLATLGLGFLLGARHALDADHVAAVSTLVSRHADLRTSGMIGLCWGIGHTAVLLVVSMLVLLLGVSIPAGFGVVVELGVGLLLVWLGASLGVALLRDRWHVHAHEHDGAPHRHLHSHRQVAHHDHPHWLSLSVRPTLIGMAHGLAGSAALMLVILATVQTWWQGLLYVAVFGIGSIIGMIGLGIVISLPLTTSSAWSRQSQVALQGLASFGSLGLGLAMIVRIGLVHAPF